MPLAQEATNAIPPVPGVGLTCHVATWYWAAREAQRLGLTAAKPSLTTLGNIGGMAVAAQPAMLVLPRAGNWNFDITPGTPPAGSVLVWLAGATHSAVVTGPNLITGYNQVQQFQGLGNNTGHTTQPPTALAANQRLCVVIPEDVIVARAGALNL